MLYLTIIIAISILVLGIMIIVATSKFKRQQYEKEKHKRLEKIRMDIERKNKGGCFKSSYKRGKAMRKEMYEKLKVKK